MSNILEDLKTKVHVMFSNFTDEQRKEIKDILAGIPNTPAPATEQAAVQLKEAETKDGKKLSYDGELIVDTVINEVTEAGSMPLAPGEYELSDGVKITVGEGGKVTAVTPAEPKEAPVMPQMAEAVKQMETKFSAFKSETESKYAKENEALKAEIAKLNENMKVAFTTIDKMLEAPVNTIDFTKARAERNWVELSEKEYSALSNADKVKYNRGKL